MSEDATVKFGYDGTAFNAGLAGQERRMVQSADRMEKAMTKVGGGGMRNMGNVSMQLQDIAVQMQSGTKASIIFAQQGSQMLSAFGPVGMIAGAIAAIGGALYLSKEKADETFKTAIKRASEFRAENARMVRESNLDNLAEGFKRVNAEVRNLDEAEKSVGSFGGKLSALIRGEKLSVRRNQVQEERSQVSATSGQMLRQVLDMSEREVQLSDMALVGQEKEAAALQRKYELEKKIVEINELSIIDSSKQQLIADAKRKAANAEAIITREAAKAEREKRQQYESELEARRQSIKLAENEVAIKELEMQGRTGEADLLKENNFITRRAHELNAGGLDAAASIALAAREFAAYTSQQRRAEAEKTRAQKTEIDKKRETLNMERKSVELLEAEAKGQTRKVAKLQEQAFITQRMKQLSGLGISPEEAESIARRELKAKKERAQFEETGRAHIGGVKQKRTMGDTFHGLDEFNRNQLKDYEPKGPPRPGYRKGQPVPMFDAFGREDVPPTSAQRTGRYMGGDRAGTRSFTQSESYTTARKMNEEAGGGLAGLVSKSNDHLSNIAAALI